MRALVSILAAATWTDAIVIAAVLLGCAITLAGLASFDPRVRSRLPIAVLARGNVAVSVGLLVLGLLFVAIALGSGES